MVSQDYVNALRAGDYLGFLRLSKFTAEKYGVYDETIGLDALGPLICCELLQSDFNEEDLKRLRVARKILEIDDKKVPGSIKYAFLAIYNAINDRFHMSATQEKQIRSLAIITNKESYKEHRTQYEAIMKAPMRAFDINSIIYEEKTLNKKDLLAARSIYGLFLIRSHIEDYLGYLESLSDEESTLFRKGIVKALLSFLKLQNMMNSEVFNMVSEHVLTLTEKFKTARSSFTQYQLGAAVQKVSLLFFTKINNQDETFINQINDILAKFAVQVEEEKAQVINVSEFLDPS